MYKLIFYIFLFFLSIYLLTFSGHFYSSDGWTSAATAKSIIINKDFALMEEDAKPLESQNYPACMRGRQGKCYSKYGILQSLLYIPLFIIGNFFSKLFPHLPFQFITQFVMSTLNCFITALTSTIVFFFSNKMGFTQRLSFFLSVIYGLFTMAFPYSKFCFCEPIVTFFLLVSIYFLFSFQASSERREYGRNLIHLIVSGIAFSFAVLTRINSLIIFPLMCMYIFVGSKKVKNCFIFIAAGFPFMILLFLYNYFRFGNIFETGYGNEIHHFNIPFFEGLYGLLFSSGKSIFVYSPILLLAPFSLLKMMKKMRYEGIVFSLIFLTFLFFYAKWKSWEGGFTWGPRFLLPTMPYLVISLGFLLHPTKNLKNKNLSLKNQIFVVLFFVLLLVSMAVQIVGISIKFNLVYEHGHHMGRIHYAFEKGVFKNISIPKFIPIVKQTKIFIEHSAYTVKNLKKVFESGLKPHEKINPDYIIESKEIEKSLDFWWLFLIFLGNPVLTIATLCISAFLITVFFTSFFLLWREMKNKVMN